MDEELPAGAYLVAARPGATRLGYADLGQAMTTAMMGATRKNGSVAR
jgi:hypothetical protein